MPVLSTNRQAYYLYAVLDTFEAGIQLEGWEVKSIRQSRISLRDSYVKVIGGEAFLVNAYVAPYAKSQNQVMDPRRTRKLLLKKRTILSLKGKVREKRLTIVPLKVYTSRSLLKVKVALVRGKRGFEKKRIEQERDVKLRLERELQEALEREARG